MVIKETADLYTKVSAKHILPGVDLVERLGFAFEDGVPQERTMALRRAELDTYQEEALKSIEKVANNVSLSHCRTQSSLLTARQKRDLVLERIDARQKALQQTRDMLPPAEDAEMIRKAVEEGTSATINQYKQDSTYVNDVLKETEGIVSLFNSHLFFCADIFQVFSDGDKLSI